MFSAPLTGSSEMHAGDPHARERNDDRPKLKQAVHQNEPILIEFSRTVKTFAIWLHKTETVLLRGGNRGRPTADEIRPSAAFLGNVWMMVAICTRVRCKRGRGAFLFSCQRSR
jgi:hypothetical protein